MRTTITVLLAALCLSVSAQHIAHYEYWTDGDEAHRTQRTVPDGDITIQVPVVTLQSGMHSFHFRAQDSNGQWSSPLTTYFMRLPAIGDVTPYLTYEYWIDDDESNRTISGANSDVVVLSVNAKALKEGMHSFHFRARDYTGKWTSPLMNYFFRLPAKDDPALPLSYEYWIDRDADNSIKGNTTGDVVSLQLNTANLSQGIHSFHFRAKTFDGSWSMPITSYFLRLPLSTDDISTISYEYWIDEDAEHPITGTTADGLIKLQVDARTLRAGMHWLSMRMRDSEGRWSAPVTHYFAKPHTVVGNLISGYYYWFNGHVEDAQLEHLSEPTSPLLLNVNLPTNNLDQEVTRENITMLATPDGRQQLAMKNVLSMRFLDQRGQWSEVMTDTFAVAVGDRVVSLTPFIVNPEADEQWKGWTTQGNRNIGTDGHWSGEKNNHFMLGNGKDSEMRQTVSGLPAGTYMLSAYGKAATGNLTLSAAGYTANFPYEGDENGWSQSTVTFVTDGEPFDIVTTATNMANGQWACIDGFELTVNGIVDKAGTLSLSDVQMANLSSPAAWNEPGSAVRLQLSGRYDNKKGREATIYYSIDNGTPMRLADNVTPSTQFGQEVECFFRENASPHTVSLYGKDTEDVMSERTVIEIGNMNRGCTVENLPQMAIYTGEPIEIDDLALRDSRTNELLVEGEDYTLLYNNNVDDGQATIVVEGVYPRYLGRRELHFTIKSHIADEELAVLRTLYDQTAGDSLWSRKWNMEKEQVLSDELAGVSVKNRHVTAIQLRGNRLTGQLPDAVFMLPALQTLNLEDNALSGTLNTNAIKSGLRELLLARNSLSRLNGKIPATVERLSLGGQTIREVDSLHLSQATLETQLKSLPNIGLYDHQQQNFTRKADIRVMTGGYNGNTLAFMSLHNGQWQLRTDEWGSRVYRQEQGDTIYCRDDAGNCFRLALTFEAGDANADGLVNVQDLSSIVLYCLNNYQATFNYTAANLWEDERVNVQDAVCLVNKLLDGTPPAIDNGSNASRMTEAGIGSAMLTISEGRLVLASPMPVSAFDIVADGVRPEDVASLLEPLGFVVIKRQQAGGTHLVGYSPTGNLLPIGETFLCMLGSQAQISHALLADDRAKAIRVICNEQTDIAELGKATVEVVLRHDMIIVSTTKAMSNVKWSLFTMDGAVIDGGRLSSLPIGVNRIPCRMVKGGIAILRLTADDRQPIVKKVSNK